MKKNRILENYLERWMVWLGVLCLPVLCGCHTDNGIPTLPRLTDANLKGVSNAVSLNGRYISDAHVRFEPIQDSDSARMTLSGVYPEGEIAMNVAFVNDADGNIPFEGEQTVENVRHLKATGIFRPLESLAAAADNPPAVQVHLTYTVPAGIASADCHIEFSEDNGFRYRRITGTYPLATPDSKLREDSCEFICRRINSKLARHLESVSFNFDGNGLMRFVCNRRGHNKTESVFRYWIREDQQTGDRIVLVENAQSFYEALLEALIPEENTAFGKLSYLSSEQIAILLVDKDGEVAVAGKMHSDILTYLYNALPTDWVWTEEERKCFNILSEKTRKAPQTSPLFEACGWTFVGNNIALNKSLRSIEE